MFSKTIRVVYLYLVSFIFLMVGIYSLINTVNKVATYYFPEPQYCMNDKYCEYGDCMTECDSNKNREIKDIIISLVTFTISTGIFAYHWSRIEKERIEEDSSKEK